MKKIITQIFIIIIIIFNTSNVFAENLTTKMIQEEKENFGISNFVQETEKFTNDFFFVLYLSKIINSATIVNFFYNSILETI